MARKPVFGALASAMARTPPPLPLPAIPAGEITYRGYLIEPESYCVHSVAWSPRVIVSVKTDDGWSRLAPLYSPNTARFPTRPDADRCALDIARAWIDAKVDTPLG